MLDGGWAVRAVAMPPPDPTWTRFLSQLQECDLMVLLYVQTTNGCTFDLLAF